MSGSADRIAAIAANGFSEYRDAFVETTGRARDRFRDRDWHGLQEDSAHRLELHNSEVQRTVAAIAVATPLPPRKAKKIGKQWPAKAAKAVRAATTVGLVRLAVLVTTALPCSPWNDSTTAIE